MNQILNVIVICISGFEHCGMSRTSTLTPTLHYDIHHRNLTRGEIPLVHSGTCHSSSQNTFIDLSQSKRFSLQCVSVLSTIELFVRGKDSNLPV